MAVQISSFDPGVVGKELIQPEYSSIGSRIDRPDLPAGTEFEYGGNIYTVSDTGRGTRRITSPETVAERALRESKAAAKGALEGVGGKIADIYKSKESTIRAEIEPLKSRYDALLEEVTRRQQEEESRATLETSRELGRRGISGTSGLSERTINEVLSPITRYYTGQAKDVGFERESGLRNIQGLLAGLFQGRTQAEIDLATKIADIESNYGSNVANIALQQAQLDANRYSTDLNAELDKQRIALAERETALTESVTFPELERQLKEAEVAKALRTGTGSTNPTAKSFFQNWYGTQTNTPFTFAPKQDSFIPD